VIFGGCADGHQPVHASFGRFPATMQLFYIGLFILVLGNGWPGPTSRRWSATFTNNKVTRDATAPSIFYMGINAGALWPR
jgi:dipeptide/tripeptide permease